jgi:hypothetical protein
MWDDFVCILLAQDRGKVDGSCERDYGTVSAPKGGKFLNQLSEGLWVYGDEPCCIELVHGVKIIQWKTALSKSNQNSALRILTDVSAFGQHFAATVC